MPFTFSDRQVFVGLVLLAVAAMLFARVYLQAYMGLAPCPLCMTQRLFVMLWGAVALVAAVHNPGMTGARIYAGLCCLSAYMGALVAARHTWLQQLPEDQVPACGPPLDYLLQNFPLVEAIDTMLMGDGNCADTLWTFLGLSIPAQTLIVFCVAIAISLWLMIRRPVKH